MKKKLSLFLCFLIIFNFSAVSAKDTDTVSTLIKDVGNYIYETVPNPQVGSIGGEWAVLGLARSGVEIPEDYYSNYYNTVSEYVKKCSGNLSDSKYTEYSRVILAITSIGKNPANVAGYNLLIPLGDYEKTIYQGINGSVWALLALDSNGYEIPKNPNAKIQATRELYINHILENQVPGGGWAFFGDTADPDITGMALQALSKYQDNAEVKSAIEKALAVMSENQTARGGFSSWGMDNPESCVQMAVALCELGIPIEDAQFIKNGNSMLDNLLTYYDSGKGFMHTKDEPVTNQMTTEQCFYALSAINRQNKGQNSLYDMGDAKSLFSTEENNGLSGKHNDIKKLEKITLGKTFDDIANHPCKTAAEELACRNIINGKSPTAFCPDDTMSRAEFAAITVRGLGLPLKSGYIFSDVSENAWYYQYINTAYAYGIINGVSENTFNPSGTITREEAAVMTSRAAKLCGIDTNIASPLDTLAQFYDYVTISPWAESSVAFCCANGILSTDDSNINPHECVTRAEIACMLYNMLILANLL